MGEVQGQGYIGQALGVADVLAVVYTDQLRYRPEDPHWPDRDRFLLSIGHYAIALYAALAEAGTIPVEELETYGSDDSRLPMSAHGVLHARHGDLRRLAGPRPRRGHRDGAGTAPPRQPGPGVQPALRRRARRGLHVGGGDVLRPPRPGQRHRDRRRQRPAGRRPHRRRAAHRAGHREVAGIRLARRCGSTATTSAALRRRLRRTARAPRHAVGADLRHPHRLRGAPARDAGRRPTSCGWTRTNGSSPAPSSRKDWPDDHHRRPARGSPPRR